MIEHLLHEFVSMSPLTKTQHPSMTYERYPSLVVTVVYKESAFLQYLVKEMTHLKQHQ